MTFDPDQLDQTQTDQGVPVGDADVEADRRNADPGAEAADDTLADAADDDGWSAPGAADQQTDQGVPVGEADVEADRRNATEPDESAI